MTQGRRLEIRAGVDSAYSDVLTPEAVAALIALRPLDARRVELMQARLERRRGRQERKQRIEFLPADGTLAGTGLTVGEARAGRFAGSEIPPDLQRQWIQGTGPAAKPGAPVEKSIRNVAYALLSGADGWMFDGEDALGQVSTMSLDNQRNLKLAIARAPLFLHVAEQVAGEMNAWARRSSAGRSSRTGGGSWTSPRGSSGPVASTSTTGTCATKAAPASRPRSSTPCSTW